MPILALLAVGAIALFAFTKKSTTAPAAGAPPPPPPSDAIPGVAAPTSTVPGGGVAFIPPPGVASSSDANWKRQDDLVVTAGKRYRFSYDPTNVGSGHTSAIFAFFGGPNLAYKMTAEPGFSALPSDWSPDDAYFPQRVYYDGTATRTGAMPTIGNMRVWAAS